MESTDMVMETAINRIDFHTHILPGMDDGAVNEDEAVAMLEALYRQRVNTVVLTPHFRPENESLNDFLKRREASFERLKKCLPASVPIRMLLGSETFLSSSLFHCEDISPLCIGGRYLLVELPYSIRFTQSVCQQIMKISYAYGVYPILAHIERYDDLMQHPKILESLVEDGLLTQINLSSWSSVWTRWRLEKLIKRGFVHLLGSDCHHLKVRPPEWRTWILKMEKSLGKERMRQFMYNAQDIVQA